MKPLLDFAEMPPQQRLHELAAILARGVLRLRRSRPPVALAARLATAERPAAAPLDVPAETVLSVHTG